MFAIKLSKKTVTILLVVLTIIGLMQSALVGYVSGQKTLVIAMYQEPQEIDMNPVRMLYTYYTAEAYPSMVEWDKDGNVIPGLAESWSISPDGLTYTYVLRDGLKWSDGEPLTSADVLFTAKVMAEQSTFWYGWVSPAIQEPKNGTVTGFSLRPGAVETPDARTVIFHLLSPNAPFFIVMGGWPILPKHSWEGMDLSTNNPPMPMVGSGPFVMQQRVPGEKIVYVANPYYYGGAPKLDQVILKFYRDAATAEIGLQSGEAGLMIGVPTQDVPVLKSNPSLEVGVEQPQTNYYIFFNHHPKLADGSVNPVADVRVRKAIAMSLDMDKMLNASFGGPYYIEANQLQVPNMYYQGKRVWNSSIPMPEYPYDPASAARLLDEAGYPADASGKRFEVNLVVPGAQPANMLKLLQLIQSRLKDVGITLDLVLMEYGSGSDRIYGAAPPKDWNMAYCAQSESPDPDVPAWWIVSTLYGNAGAGGFNAGGYNNTLVDQLVLQGRETVDVDKRVAIYQRISGIVHEELGVLELFYPLEVNAWNKMYQGFILGLGNPQHDYWGMIKADSLVQVHIVEQTTTTPVTTTTTTPTAVVDYTTIALAVAVLIIVVGAAAYFAGRRGKKSR
jgi:peptide/nickel transport system substrate-binding protein